MEKILEQKKEELEKFIFSFLENITHLQLEIMKNKNNIYVLTKHKYKCDDIILAWINFEITKFMEELNYLKMKILKLKKISENNYKTYSKN